MKCLRCEMDEIIEDPDNGEGKEFRYYCETCGATYELIDDSGE